jgi:hypothetical protein
MNDFPNVYDLECIYGVRWCQLADLEPRVQQLLWRARQAGAGCHSWSDVDRIFSPLRNDLAGLLGFSGRYSRHPVLGSLGAYEVAYWKLHEAVAGLLPRSAAAVAETTPTAPATSARNTDLTPDRQPVSAGMRIDKKLQLAEIS